MIYIHGLPRWLQMVLAPPKLAAHGITTYKSPTCLVFQTSGCLIESNSTVQQEMRAKKPQRQQCNCEDMTYPKSMLQCRSNRPETATHLFHRRPSAMRRVHARDLQLVNVCYRQSSGHSPHALMLAGDQCLTNQNPQSKPLCRVWCGDLIWHS